MAQIRCDKNDGIWVLTIDNEPKRNAFSGDMVYALRDLLDEADTTPKVRCVIITGAGDTAFSSGHDLSEMLDHGDAAFSPEANAGFLRPTSMKKPVIAAVNGYAYAAGLILSLSCDLRVVSSNASFCASGARVGLLPIGWPAQSPDALDVLWQGSRDAVDSGSDFGRGGGSGRVRQSVGDAG